MIIPFSWEDYDAFDQLPKKPVEKSKHIYLNSPLCIHVCACVYMCS